MNVGVTSKRPSLDVPYNLDIGLIGELVRILANMGGNVSARLPVIDRW